jgi:TetR/AcrR family transcriptional regulator, transcriptional repressor for nem operon
MTTRTTRDEIVEAADQLFYKRGFEHTSFADLADAVQISRGNFYHHFKTKDEVLDAVIGKRFADRQAMLGKWEIEGGTPEERIESFIRILNVNRAKIKRHGCPVGTLCTELAKLSHPSEPHANELFILFRTWLARQFALLGRKADADGLALHLLARSQGAALLANAFRDDDFVDREVALMCEWVKAQAKKRPH